MHKRDLLKGLAAAAFAPLAACETADPEKSGPVLSSRAAVFFPGYRTDDARLLGEPADSRRRRGVDGPRTMLTRVGADGSVRQAVFPVIGHDVAIAPDGSVGFLGRMGDGGGDGAAHHVAFDPVTLEMVATGLTPGPGWRGGGHGVFVPGGPLLCAERAPMTAYSGSPERHFGRVSVRDRQSLALLGSFSCHGIDPHEIRLSEDGRHVVLANYGSVAGQGQDDLSVPRRVVAPCLTVVEIATGRLVERIAVAAPETELRHLALRPDGTAFGIRCRLAPEGADAPWLRKLGLDETDRTADPGESYLPATPVLASRGTARTLAAQEPPAHLRHGLSVEYDALHDEFIASFPSSHRLIVFSGGGEVRHSIDTRDFGLAYPCGVTLMPGETFYAVAGFWRGLRLMRRGDHRPEHALATGAAFRGHSHITAA
ncbi:DUF1513 domain-containing protein [Thetidibacter halocola]|uniref:DUF1513 domain-containing protein n=1 Tax=Thetidibacter halocola TaxID=2827239 RepID=A0A8J8B846_9RHOB|nr:DUF1513 domain-containing protein [Thetidibacter halocola]MBS0124369.1 DUF1513 domain-containing protein [Thetidibacter halocola]